MPDFSHLNVHGSIYSVKDETARTRAEHNAEDISALNTRINEIVSDSWTFIVTGESLVIYKGDN